MPAIKLLSYNIHKGFNLTNQQFVLSQIRDAIIPLQADLLFLQEVIGEHSTHRARHKDWPETSQFEFLAESIWPHFTYGKNSVYTEGHHGNAILSKHPIVYWENQGLSQSWLDPKGLLHAAIKFPSLPHSLHVICVHLSFIGFNRREQLRELCERVEKVVPANAPLIIAGDFNDWSGQATDLLKSKLGMQESFQEIAGSHAATFPSWLPILRLDRVYYRGLRCRAATSITEHPWTDLSDHLPLLVELETLS